MDVKLGYAPKFFRNGELSVREASRGFIYSMKASGSIQTGTFEALENTLALFAPFPAESIDMKPINDRATDTRSRRMCRRGLGG